MPERGRAGTLSMLESARRAMPPKGDPAERSAILFGSGEVAEWLKAAPC
jgi:hypothetical protein